MVNRLKGFESRYKSEHQGAGQSRANGNSQNMNRSQQNDENAPEQNVYSALARSINGIRNYSQVRNRAKIKEFESRK